jgi:hypothetical protein
MDTKSNVSLPNGPAAAALLGGGIGSAIFGMIVLFSELNESFATSLNWYKPVGPLFGKSLLGIAAFFISWAVLHFMWKDREVDFNRISTLSIILLAAALLFTFPPFWHLFTGG